VTATKLVRAPPHRNAAPTESHNDGQDPGYFSRTLRTVLLALSSSEPPLFIGTPRLLCGNSYLWRVCVVIYESPTTDCIHRICQVVEAAALRWTFEAGMREVSHPIFKTKTRCSSYVCLGSSCHTYGQNVSTEYQCLYYIISYYKNLLQVQKGLNSGMDTILPQAVDRRFHMRRRNLHQRTPHLLSSRA
jgi:hypothetical protein